MHVISDIHPDSWVFVLAHPLIQNITSIKALLGSKMERRQVTVKNFQLVSYNRFDSSEDKDGMDEDNLANQNVRIIRSEDGPPVSRYYRLAAVFLTLLCVLLIFAVLGLWVKFNNLTTKNTDLQTHYNNLILKNDQLESSNNNLTVERDRLKTSDNNLTIKRDWLQTSYNNLTIERDRLQTSYNNLTIERDRLQTSYNNLTIERDRLQTTNNNLTIERDRLQTRYNNLTIERDRQQTRYNNLTIERDRLQTRYNNLTIERDRLQTTNNNLTIERDWLQTTYNNLTIVRARDQEKCKALANKINKLQTNYSSLANQQDQLQKEKERLQNNFGELAAQARLGWVYFNFNLYFISNEKKIWPESRQDCKKKGADLVIIRTKEEEDFLVEQLGSDKAWIGLNDKNTEGVWKWVDGTSVTTAYWAPGEPNDAGKGEDCAELWGFKEKQGWNDGPCSDKVRWACKKPFHTSQ
ncbi:uncharacterized protein Hap1MRO34_016144 isoform 1-T1 [Clarias gariepinus]|nr:C-type lectin domain family 4 member M-like isoform X2 [Clarias gariepinus]